MSWTIVFVYNYDCYDINQNYKIKGIFNLTYVYVAHVTG